MLYRHLKGTAADKDTGFTAAPPAVAGRFAGVDTETSELSHKSGSRRTINRRGILRTT